MDLENRISGLPLARARWDNPATRPAARSHRSCPIAPKTRSSGHFQSLPNPLSGRTRIESAMRGVYGLLATAGMKQDPHREVNRGRPEIGIERAMPVWRAAINPLHTGRTRVIMALENRISGLPLARARWDNPATGPAARSHRSCPIAPKTRRTGRQVH